jgi:radical SAM superfamily enzyme YgiQ (UPF0313 family)
MDAIFLSSCISHNQTNIFRPLGPYQIAWHLRQHQYNVQVIDFIFKFTEEQTLRLIERHMTPNTKVLGIGFMISLYNPAMGTIVNKFENILRAVKKRYPWVKIIVGGPSGSYWAKLHRNGSLFDYVFTGHAENSTLALFEHLYRNAPHPQFEIIDGNKFIKETFAFPQEKLFDISECKHTWDDKDCIQPNETLPLELGRGCIFKCKFCRYPHIGKNKRDFNRSMECVKHELIDNFNKWNVTNYYMLDDTFNADQERLKEFADMVETLPFKIRYVTYLRPDLISAHPESAHLLLNSGLTGAFLGVESLNAESCALIGKPWSAKNAKDFIPKLIHDTWQDKVGVQIGLICGLPPETYNDCNNANQWCIDNNIPGWIWHALHVERNAHTEYKSEFDVNAEQYGFKWIVRNGKTIWQTDFCDGEIVDQWFEKLTNDSKLYQNLTCWVLLEMGTYNIDLDVAMKTKVQEFDWKSLIPIRTQWLKTYFKQILAM